MAIVLRDIYDRKNNYFDDLRFILATLVVFYHSYELIKEPTHDLITMMVLGQSSLGEMAVYAFFTISGFFMIQSLENSKSSLKYFRNRLYRIIPAFWCSLIFFSLLIIPLFSKVSLYGEDGIITFILKAGSFHIFDYSWTIKGAFPDNTFVDNINGSMWTLKHELAAYIMLPIFYALSYKNRWFMLLFTIILFILSLLSYSEIFLFNLPVGEFWILSENEYGYFVRFLYYFMIGGCFYLYKDKIFLGSSKLDLRWFLFLSLLLVLSFYGGKGKYILFIWVPYVILLSGCIFKYKFFSKFGDYSYGIYIYSFPIQQLVLLKDSSISALGLFFTSMFFTLLVSIISYHFLEKPILNLKR